MKRGYADTPHGQIHYVVAGQGAPVVLIAPSKRSWRVHADLIPLLARRYRVLSPDNYGYGNSDPLPPDATIDMLAEGVMASLDAIGEKQRSYKSEHKYDLGKYGLTEEQIRKDCAFLYETFLPPLS